ncbi:MAG: DUF4340 domain-containing protein [Pseudomonadota bacterium]
MDKFSSLKIDNQNGKNFFEKDSQNNWLMNNLWYADKRIIYKLRKFLYDTKIEKQIPYKDSQDLIKFGLDKPWVTLKFTREDKTYTLNFGDRSPVGVNFYALASWYPGNVLLLNFTRLFDMLSEDSFQWQDHRLLYEIPDAKKAVIKLVDYDEEIIVDFANKEIWCKHDQETDKLSVSMPEFLKIIDRLKYSYQEFGMPAEFNLNYPEMTINLFDVDGKMLRNVKISSLNRKNYCFISDGIYKGKIFIMEQVKANVTAILHQVCQK